jgi:hypothetical protein
MNADRSSADAALEKVAPAGGVEARYLAFLETVTHLPCSGCPVFQPQPCGSGVMRMGARMTDVAQVEPTTRQSPWWRPRSRPLRRGHRRRLSYNRRLAGEDSTACLAGFLRITEWTSSSPAISLTLKRSRLAEEFEISHDFVACMAGLLEEDEGQR